MRETWTDIRHRHVLKGGTFTERSKAGDTFVLQLGVLTFLQIKKVIIALARVQNLAELVQDDFEKPISASGLCVTAVLGIALSHRSKQTHNLTASLERG